MGSKDLFYVVSNSATAIPFIGILRAAASVELGSQALEGLTGGSSGTN